MPSLQTGLAAALLLPFALGASAQSGDTFTVTTAADAGPGSLRAAIEASNANGDAGQDVIAFAIDGGGSYQEIFLDTLLPAPTSPVTIDGDTQGCDLSEGLCIRLDGAALLGQFDRGLRIDGGNSAVHGLVMTRFGLGLVEEDTGVSALVLRSSGNVVTGCYFGTDRTGTVTDPDGMPGSGDELGNAFGMGVQVIGLDGDPVANNRIGGPTLEDRNVISGSRFSGISIQQEASGTQILGNHVGTDVTGTLDLGNGAVGITVVGPAGQLLIQGNVVSGNDGDGISIQSQSADNVIRDNFIGTDVTGTVALPNGTLPGLADQVGFGIVLRETSGNLVEDNLVSGNLFGGIVVGGTGEGIVATGNVLRGNHIGVDASGEGPLPNGVAGIADIGFGVVLFTDNPASSTSDNVIGGDLYEDANVIGFNTTAGVGMQGPNVTGNVIDHNYIGVTPDGDAIPNGILGVLVRQFPSANRFGSLSAGGEAGGGNVLGFQQIGFGFGESVSGADVAFNTFVGQPGAYLPIDLGLNGPTADDAGDPDAGPNALQNAPVIEQASATGDQVTVTYRVDTAPANAAYPLTVRFYGRYLDGGLLVYAPLGEGTYAESDAQASATATFTVAGGLPAPGATEIVATATDALGNTGEASLAGRPVSADAAPTAFAGTHALSPVHPNPAVASARFTLRVAEAQTVRAEVYDVLGRRVAVVLDGAIAPGAATSVAIDSARLAGGTYVLRVTGERFREAARFTVAR